MATAAIQSNAVGTEPSSSPSDRAGLTAFIAEVVGEAPLRVEESLGEGFVRLRVSEAERRQAKHDIRCVEDAVVELLRNARDAGAHTVFLATARTGDVRSVVCIDDGVGIPTDMHERVFEARVTSKLDTMYLDAWGVHGRGMALYSIRANALEARVRASAPGCGAAVSATFDCGDLAERTDQSTWPHLGTGEDGRPAVARGPHNVARAVVEFALDARKRNLVVYLGSPAEIAATLVVLGLQVHDSGVATTMDETPIWLRPARAARAAQELVLSCASLGLEVSARSAYRILNGEVPALKPALSYAVRPQRRAADVDLERDRRSLKIAPADLDDFSQSLARAFSSTMGERYYLELEDLPKVHVSGDTVTVTFKVTKE